MSPKPRERGVQPPGKQPRSKPNTGLFWLLMVGGGALFLVGLYMFLGSYSSHATQFNFGSAFMAIGFLTGVVGVVRITLAKRR